MQYEAVLCAQKQEARITNRDPGGTKTTGRRIRSWPQKKAQVIRARWFRSYREQPGDPNHSQTQKTSSGTHQGPVSTLI